MKRTSKLRTYRLFYEKIPAKIPAIRAYPAVVRRKRVEQPLNILENLDENK